MLIPFRSPEVRPKPLSLPFDRWCLIELLEASSKNIPIIVVQIANGGFDFADAHSFVASLEDEMGELNPSGLKLLHELLGPDLSNLTEACLRALVANDGHQVVFDPHAGDNIMVAMMKDIVETMASCTGQTIIWKGGDQRLKRKALVRQKSQSKGGKWGRRNSIKLEDLKPIRKVDHRMAEVVGNFGPIGIFRGARRMVSDTISRRSWSGSRPSSTTADSVPEVTNIESAIFVCCSRADAVSHARVLRSELSMRLNRGCAVGGGTETSTFIAESEAFVVLLTYSCRPDRKSNWPPQFRRSIAPQRMGAGRS